MSINIVPTVDIDIYKGITFPLDFQINVKDANGNITGPFDLTNYELVMYVEGIISSKNWSSSDAPDTDGSFIAIGNDPTLGQFSIKLTATTLSVIQQNVGSWRIVRKPDANNAELLFTGTISVKSFTTDGRI